MSSDQDWKLYRLENLERLRTSTFTFGNYTAPSADWDHDHCEGCWATFAEFEAPEVLHGGYFTTVQIANESVSEPEMIQQARESGRKVLRSPTRKCGSAQNALTTFVSR